MVNLWMIRGKTHCATGWDEANRLVCALFWILYLGCVCLCPRPWPRTEAPTPLPRGMGSLYLEGWGPLYLEGWAFAMSVCLMTVCERASHWSHHFQSLKNRKREKRVPLLDDFQSFKKDCIIHSTTAKCCHFHLQLVVMGEHREGPVVSPQIAALALSVSNASHPTPTLSNIMQAWMGMLSLLVDFQVFLKRCSTIPVRPN